MRYTRYDQKLDRYVVPALINPNTNKAITFNVYVEHGNDGPYPEASCVFGEVIDRLAELENQEEAKHGERLDIVRCKDCKNRVKGSKMCAHPKAVGWDAIEPDDDAFCSYGEREEESHAT